MKFYYILGRYKEIYAINMRIERCSSHSMKDLVSKVYILTFFLLCGQCITYGQSQPDKVYVKKGSLLFDINFPYINSYLLHPENEGTQKKAGFLGFGLGADYYLTNDSHLNFSTKGVIDFLAPVPAPVHYDRGSFYFLSTNYIQLTMNNDFKKLHIGYGIVYGQNIWRYRLFGNDTTYTGVRNIDKVYAVAGIIGTVSYSIGKSFYLSFVYRPTFIQFLRQPTFQYEHLGSIEFGWKIRFKK